MGRQGARRQGSSGIGPQWEAQAQTAFLDLGEWRGLHPSASLAEIEQELDRRWEAMRARMLADLALASRATTLQGEERAACPACGTPLQDAGVHRRTLVTLGNQSLDLLRDYGTCPQCGSGVFPPGR